MEEIFPIASFIFISITISLLLHNRMTSYALACILSGILASVTYQILGVIFMGYLDPFFMIAFINTTIIAVIIAIIAGIPFLCMRRRNKDKEE